MRPGCPPPVKSSACDRRLSGRPANAGPPMFWMRRVPRRDDRAGSGFSNSSRPNRPSLMPGRSNLRAVSGHQSLEKRIEALTAGTGWPSGEGNVDEATRRAQFEAIFHEHVGRVYAVILRLIRDDDVAGDVVQDAFLHAWRAFPRFRGESQVGTWLYRIAVRRAWHRLRADRRYATRVVTDSELDAYRQAAQRAFPDTRIDLEAAIAGLPDGARAALVLYEIEGYDYEQIAVLLDVSIGTVRSQIHRARRLLRDRLEPPDGAQ